jgi:hypothetical protein
MVLVTECKVHPRTSLRVTQVPSPVSIFLMLTGYWRCGLSVLRSDQHTDSKASKRDRLTWRYLLKFQCAMETKKSTYTSCVVAGYVTGSTTGTLVASGRAAIRNDVLHGDCMVSLGGTGSSNTPSSGCFLKAAQDLMLALALARSHIVSMVRQKKYG